MADTSQVKALTSQLEQGVKDLFNSDTYAEYLKTMSRFHRYSTRNTLLIHMQRPDATLCSGFRSWQTKFGRHVRKGAKAIKILAPAPFVVREEKEKLDPDTRLPVLDENGMPIVELTQWQFARFKVTSVFDVSDTEGKPLPSLVQDLTGNVEQYAAFMDALRDVSPLPIVFEPLPSDTDGICHFGDRIAIREGMSEVQTVCAVIHEITHARLHDLTLTVSDDENIKPKDRHTEEVEAESVAFCVTAHFGIETGANSFGYISSWSESRELKELNASLDTIRKTSAELIDAIDERFREIAKERDIVFAIGEEQDELTEPEQSKPDAITQTPIEQKRQPTDNAEVKNPVENNLYNKFAGLFPDFADGKYSYMRLESGGFEPLSIEWIGGDRISIMHTYTMNGDLMYDPMMTFDVDRDARTMSAAEYEISMPPLYQRVNKDGSGASIDGNGREHTVTALQSKLNDFASDWLDSIADQGYMPVKAHLVLGEDNEVRVTFDADGNLIMPEPEQDKTVSVMLDDRELEERIERRLLESYERTGASSVDGIPGAYINPDQELAITRLNLWRNDGVGRELFLEYEREQFTKTEQTLEPLRESSMTDPSEADSSSDTLLPDASIGFSEMNLYGYSDDGVMLPLLQARAVELFDADHTIYLLYPDNTEAMAFDRDEILSHDGLFGIEREEWAAALEFAAMKDAVRTSEGSLEADLLYGGGNRFGIYQVKNGEETCDFRFTSMEHLEALGLSIDRGNYQLVYTAPFSERIEFLTDRYPVLNRIYEKFNTEHPEDYTGRSVSVSDVIVLKYNGDVSSHFVDSIGFKEIDAFLGEERHQTQAVAPTVAELEAEVEAGKSISLSDLSKAVKSERESLPASPTRKLTLMERLEKNKQKAAMQGQPDARKTNDREV